MGGADDGGVLRSGADDNGEYWAVPTVVELYGAVLMTVIFNSVVKHDGRFERY